MQPKKHNNQSGCVNSSPSSCIPWSGPNIPCLGIKTGDSMTEVTFAIAEETVRLGKELNLEDINITCLIDDVALASEDKTLAKLLQLLYDNQCKLDQKSGGTTVSTPTAININLKCMRLFDAFQNEIPQDLNQSLQSIANQVCADKDKITLLEALSNSLQSQIDCIDSNPTVGEVDVVTCITPTAKPVSEALIAVADDACTYKTKVGAAIDIQGSLAVSPPIIGNLKLLPQNLKDAWVLKPANMAQMFTNALLTIEDLRLRLKYMEDTCCKPACENVKVGFIVTANADGDAVTLKFTTGAGTKIPAGFVDAGSVLTITDKDGIFAEYDTVVAQGATTDEYDITSLDLSDFLTFGLTVKMVSDTGISCEKCITKRWKPNSICPFCTITVTGPTPSSALIITYEETIL